jgi:hypothetical protein
LTFLFFGVNVVTGGFIVISVAVHELPVINRCIQSSTSGSHGAALEKCNTKIRCKLQKTTKKVSSPTPVAMRPTCGQNILQPWATVSNLCKARLSMRNKAPLQRQLPAGL